VEHDQALAGFDEVEEGLLGAGGPLVLGKAAVVVVEDDEVVGGEGLGAGAAELFGEADVEEAGGFEGLLEEGGDGLPIVAADGAAGDEQSLNFLRRGLRGEGGAGEGKQESIRPHNREPRDYSISQLS